MSIDNNPEQRKIFIDDWLKKKGLHKGNEQLRLTPEQQIFQRAMRVWTQVKTGTAKPFLFALKDHRLYDSGGMQVLLMQAFRDLFKEFSKDDMLFLLSVMHAEELEKEVKQCVEQGLHGPDMNKPI